MAVAAYRTLTFSDGGVLFVSLYSLPQTALQQTTVAAAQVTSGTTELTLATLSVAAYPASYVVECSSSMSGFNSVAGDTFESRIKVDGTQVGQTQNRHSGGVNERRPYNVPTTTSTTIAADTTSSITLTVVRTGGTGTLTTELTGLLTARLYFP